MNSRMGLGGRISLMAACGVLAASAATTVSTVDELVTALDAAKTDIVLKPGIYDLTGRTPVTAISAGLSTSDTRLSYLLLRAATNLRGENTTHWSQKTSAEESVIKCDNAQARLIYAYGGGGRGSKFYHITFEGGNGQSVTGDNGDGGAIYFMDCGGGFVTNCVFRNCHGSLGGATHAISAYDSLYTNCTAVSGGGASANGAIFAYKSPTNVIQSCVFADCHATVHGGGLYFDNCQDYDTTNAGRVDGCYFTNCTAASFGGALYEPRPGLVKNCRFAGNSSQWGAVSSPTNAWYDGKISNCTFTANSATEYGGAVGYWNTIRDSVFTGNSAKNGSGAVLCAKAYDSYFTNNTAGASSYGGVMTRLEGTFRNCEGYFEGCTFSENTAIGIAARAGALQGCIAQDCLFVKNHSGCYGGACYSSVCTNCVFTENTSTNQGGSCWAGTYVGCSFTGNKSIIQRGGALHGATAINCAFTNNYVLSTARGGAANASRCYGCYFTGVGEVSGGTIVSCEFDGIIGNRSTSPSRVFDAVRNCGSPIAITNCLVHHCQVSDLVYNEGNNMDVVNCTFADNLISNESWLAGMAIRVAAGTDYVKKSGSSDYRYYPATNRVINCVFSGNKFIGNRNNGGAADMITYFDAAATDFGTSCSIISNTLWTGGYSVADSVVKGNLRQGPARFVGNHARYREQGLPYYSLQRSSGAVNLGLPIAWPADATDLAGAGRVNEGAVDAGCYECYLALTGTLFIVR